MAATTTQTIRLTDCPACPKLTIHRGGGSPAIFIPATRED